MNLLKALTVATLSLAALVTAPAVAKADEVVSCSFTSVSKASSNIYAYKGCVVSDKGNGSATLTWPDGWVTQLQTYGVWRYGQSRAVYDAAIDGVQAIKIKYNYQYRICYVTLDNSKGNRGNRTCIF